MILPEAFNKNENLRSALVQARPIMDIAFYAAMNRLDEQQWLDDTNVLTNAQNHAKRVGVLEFVTLIRSMTGVPAAEPSPMLDTHLGLDAFDLIGVEAERQAAEKEESLQPKTKKRK